MGQHEVEEWLKAKRLSGDESFFSSKEIYKGLIEKEIDLSIYTIRRNLWCLDRWSKVETMYKGDIQNWFRRYRWKLNGNGRNHLKKNNDV